MRVSALMSTIPPKFTMVTTETLRPGFDTTPLLLPGQSPVSAACVLTDLTTDIVSPLDDDPTIEGNIIEQILRGSELIAAHAYELAWTFVVDATTIWTAFTEIIVPQ
jgi:hypothetical protein